MSAAEAADHRALNSPRWFGWGLALLFVCDLAKHVFLMFAGPAQPWPDSHLYWRLGQAAAGGDWWLIDSAQAFRTPLYPWFLAVMQMLFGTKALLAVVLTQHGCELATSLLTSFSVKNVTGSARAALTAYGFSVLLTARALFANTILTESIATLLVAVLIWQFSRLTLSPSWSNLCFAALALGLQVLLRPAAVAFLPALAWVSWTMSPTAALRRRGLQVAAAMGICAVIIAPWCVRNRQMWNRSALVVFTGRQLWTANFSPWPGGGLEIPEIGAGGRLRTLLVDESIDLRHNWSVASALSRRGLTDVEVDDLMRDASLEAIQAQWQRAAFHFGARCLTFWYVKDWELDEAQYPPQKPWETQRSWSSPGWSMRLRNALRLTPERFFQPMWLWTVFTWTGIAGLLSYPATRRYGMALALMLAGLTVLTAAFEIPCYRYRCIVEPAMAAAVVAGTCSLLFKYRPITLSSREHSDTRTPG